MMALTACTMASTSSSRPRRPIKLAKVFIETNAAGIRITDQEQCTKKCGHTGGKVSVGIWEHIQHLVAILPQVDDLKSELGRVAHTDAEAVTMTDSNMYPIDHPFIKGVTVRGMETLYNAIKKGKDQDWERHAGAMTHPQAMAVAMKAKDQAPAEGLKDMQMCKGSEGFTETAEAMMHLEIISDRLKREVVHDNFGM